MNLLKNLSLLILSVFLSVFSVVNTVSAQQNAEPIKALMITGGGPFHDYYTQKEQLKDGLIERIGNIEITKLPLTMRVGNRWILSFPGN